MRPFLGALHGPVARLLLLATAIVLISGLVFSAAAQAQTKPFKISGSGVGPDGLPPPGAPPRMHSAVGEATHLGRYYGKGTLKTDSAVLNPATGIFSGEFGSGEPFVFQGANGDKLVCYYGRTDHGAAVPGKFELTMVGFTPPGSPTGTPIVTANFVAEFVAQPDLSTGKFAGVTGSWIMYARSAPFVLNFADPVVYSWEGEGKLNFPKK